MGKKQIQKSLTIFSERIKNQFQPESILLFGSYASNKANTFSDIDILVVAKKFTKIPFDKRLDVLYEITRDLYPDFHVYGLTPDEFKSASPLTIISEIKQKGINIL